MDNWILTKDKLPKHGQRVIVYTHTGMKAFKHFIKDDLFYSKDHGYSNVEMVTHWIPEPKDPETPQYKPLTGNVKRTITG